MKAFRGIPTTALRAQSITSRPLSTSTRLRNEDQAERSPAAKQAEMAKQQQDTSSEKLSNDSTPASTEGKEGDVKAKHMPTDAELEEKRQGVSGTGKDGKAGR